MKETVLHFIKDGIPYYYEGESGYNYYDNCTWVVDGDSVFTDLSLLDQTIFLTSFGGLIDFAYSVYPEKCTFPKVLIKDLYDLVGENYYHAYQYFGFYEFETLENVDTDVLSFKEKKIKGRKVMTLITPEVTIIVPSPYHDIYVEDDDGDYYESIGNFKTYPPVKFKNDHDFPLIFMSEEQRKKNQQSVLDVVNNIAAVFQKHGYDVKDARDVEHMYEKIKLDIYGQKGDGETTESVE